MSLRGAKASIVMLDEFAEFPTKRIQTFTLESKTFQETLHYADPILYSYAELGEMVKWCYSTFGNAGHDVDKMHTVWDFKVDPDYMFWFGDEKNLMLFILRWS